MSTLPSGKDLPDVQTILARPEIQRRQLSSQVASALRQDILFGHLAPGTRLSQQELCERFGTSRMPVRDALRELVYSGLLEQDDGRHAVVASLNSDDLVDSFTIEGLLSGYAARKATAHATDEDIHDLEILDALMRKSHAEGRTSEMAMLNWQFHRKLNRLSRSPRIIAALRAVSLEVPRDYLAEVPDWAERSNNEHTQLIEALKSRDADLVEKLMIDHLVESGIGLTNYLERKGFRLQDASAAESAVEPPKTTAQPAS